MNGKVIGIGAAGNKAAIAAIEAGVVDKKDVFLINSTLKDIPADYDGAKYCFNKAYGGCGKERSIAKNYMLTDLQSGDLDLKGFLEVGVADKQAELVIIVSSTEGGTGSGSAPILARYIKEVMGIPSRCFSFVGFADDPRGLRNTVEYFNEMEDAIAIESVSNLKYLDDANGDKIAAEKLANKDFCVKLSVLFGNMLRDCDHNIDPTDHLKICQTPNFSIVEYREFNKIKNKKEFKEMVQEMVDESKSIDLSFPSQKRLAVIINIPEESTGIIDYSETLIAHFGECFEKFEHIEHEKSLPNFFAFISVGNKVPVKEIEELYESYQERSKKVSTDPDEFYGNDKFAFDPQDDKFNLGSGNSTKSASEFFTSVSGGSKQATTATAPAKKGVSTSKGNVTDNY